MSEREKSQEITVGQRIKELRKQKGYSQGEIGKKINIRQRLVSDYETGRLRLSVEILVKFANALEVNITDLITNDNSKKNIKSTNLKLAQRMRKIETLSPSQQKMIIKTIDALLKATEM